MILLFFLLPQQCLCVSVRLYVLHSAVSPLSEKQKGGLLESAAALPLNQWCSHTKICWPTLYEANGHMLEEISVNTCM